MSEATFCVNANYLTKNFGSMTLLSWILDVFELDRMFYQAQLEGIVPADEIFTPHFFMRQEPGGDRFPYWLSARSRLRLQQLHKKGLVKDFASSGIRGRDENGVLRGLEFVKVTASTGIVVKSAMRDQRFPVCMDDLFDEILGIQLVERVVAHLEGKVPAVGLTDIDAMIESLEETCGPCSGHFCSRPSASDNGPVAT